MSSTQTERQNAFVKGKSNSLDVSLVDGSVDNEFAGLIDTDYLSEEVKSTETVYEMDMNQGPLLLQENPTALENDSEYFLMGSVNECSGSNEMFSNMHEESFYLNTETGNISVTLNDLIEVGVNVNTDVISIDVDQTNALLKLVQSRDDPSAAVEYVSNFETIEPKDNDGQYGTSSPQKQLISNLYAYIEADGTVLLVEDKTEKQIAKFTREELEQFGIMDVNKITDAELQKLARTVIDMEQPPSCSLPSVPYSTTNKRLKTSNHFIGENVEVISEKFRTPVNAVIRYMRKNNGTFKVQYEDGQFEWIENSSQIIRRVNQGRSLTRKIKKPQPKNDSIDKVSTKSHTHDNCALCDKKINTKPAFIVIRLPACRECSYTKALMLEDKLCNITHDESVPNNPSLLINRRNLTK